MKNILLNTTKQISSLCAFTKPGLYQGKVKYQPSNFLRGNFILRKAQAFAKPLLGSDGEQVIN